MTMNRHNALSFRRGTSQHADYGANQGEVPLADQSFQSGKGHVPINDPYPKSLLEQRQHLINIPQQQTQQRQH